MMLMEKQRNQALQLEELPSLIASQESTVARVRNKHQLARLDLEQEKAKKLLAMKFLQLNEKEKAAKLVDQLADQERTLLAIELELKLEEVEFNRLNNIFVALRKQCSFQIAEMQTFK